MVSLLAALALTLAAFTTQWNELVFVAVVLAIVPLVITVAHRVGSRLQSGDMRWQAEGVIQAWLRSEGYDVDSLELGSSSDPQKGRAVVPFHAQTTLPRPLYKEVPAPWDKLGDLTARRIEGVSRQLDRLAEVFGDEATKLKAGMPRNPYNVTYVAEKTPKGHRHQISGSVAFAVRGLSRVYTLEHLSFGHTDFGGFGHPIQEFPDAVFLGTVDGERWLSENAAAWSAFLRKVAALQDQVDLADADRAERAVQVFFRLVKAGMVFEGTGHSSSEQHDPVRFFADLQSVDAANRTVTFLLRNDRDWSHARRFVGRVDFDAVEKAVCVHGRTEGRDARAEAGPIIGAQNAFSLDFHFRAGSPLSLTSSGGDVRMKLEEVARSTLRELREKITGKQRRVTDVLQPGAGYSGEFTSAGGSGPLGLSVLEASGSAHGLEVKLEAEGWSEIFHGVDMPAWGGSAGARDGRLAFTLEPLSHRAGVPTAESRWRSITLTAFEAGALLQGVAESALGPCDITLRRNDSAAARNEASPAEAAVDEAAASAA